MVAVLLIDDDEFENVVLTRILANHVKYGFTLDFARSVDEAVNFLQKNTYNYVYLDDQLSYRVNATVSVGFIKEHLKGAPLVVISNNIDQEHLRDKNILQVSDIVSKQDWPEYVYNSAA